jgi:hypothetical protein
VTAAWVTVVLLVLGVPLLAFWLGGRRVWARIEARGANDPAAEILRRHGLSTREAGEVVSAVTRGEALADPGQRAAAVELAELTLRNLYPRWQDASVTRRVFRVLAAVWAVSAVSALVFAVAFGRLGDVNWFVLPLIFSSVGTPLWQSWKLRRAVALNSGPADTPTV